MKAMIGIALALLLNACGAAERTDTTAAADASPLTPCYATGYECGGPSDARGNPAILSSATMTCVAVQDSGKTVPCEAEGTTYFCGGTIDLTTCRGAGTTCCFW